MAQSTNYRITTGEATCFYQLALMKAKERLEGSPIDTTRGVCRCLQEDLSGAQVLPLLLWIEELLGDRCSRLNYWLTEHRGFPCLPCGSREEEDAYPWLEVRLIRLAWLDWMIAQYNDWGETPSPEAATIPPSP